MRGIGSVANVYRSLGPWGAVELLDGLWLGMGIELNIGMRILLWGQFNAN